MKQPFELHLQYMVFYHKTISDALKAGTMSVEDSILVVCGGNKDFRCFYSLGFKKVTITNVDPRMDEDSFAPFKWEFQDAEHLTYQDEQFDFVIVHAGLHHCASPHRGLLEMYRVARKGIFVFESRDNALIRLAKKLGFARDYEFEAVVGNNHKYGGFRNTEIPNYVYRWKEAEVIKTIQSFMPTIKHSFRFFYHLKIPLRRLSLSKNPLQKAIGASSSLFFKGFTLLFPKQCNEFAFCVLKTDEIHEWILKTKDGYTVNSAYLDQHFHKPAAKMDH